MTVAASVMRSLSLQPIKLGVVDMFIQGGGECVSPGGLDFDELPVGSPAATVIGWHFSWVNNPWWVLFWHTL